MRTKPLRHWLAAFLCCTLFAGYALTQPCAAFTDDEEGITPGIVLRITPPDGHTQESAPVEVRITDNAKAGFQSAQVKAGDASDWQDVTGILEQREGHYYHVVDVTENCTVYARVTGMDGTLYEKSRYIDCFPMPSGGQTATASQPTQAASASTDPSATPDTTPRAPTALTPSGQGTMVDNVTSEDEKEFYTIQTQDENTFYLVIDKQREQENVYFLNAVTESDLMSLAEKTAPETVETPAPEPVCSCKEKCEAGAVDTACPVCVLSLTDCKGVAAAAPGGETPKEPSTRGDNKGTMALILLVVLGAGGAGWYFKIYKPKHDLDNAEDLDALTSGEGDDEPTVNEDAMPAYQPRPRAEPYYDTAEPGEQKRAEPVSDREPEEPDYTQYPGSYEDEPEEPGEYEDRDT